MSNAVEVKNLVKRYKKAERNAVDDVSFSVSEGEFFTLLGPNGAGKTTTISILTTMLTKTAGTVTIGGYDIDKHEKTIRERIGVIFQAPSIDMNLTAEENIRLHASLYGLYTFMPMFSIMSEAYKKQVLMLAELIGIKDALFDPIKTFSGGMKRKLEIVRGLMHRPAVLFLDEPTTGLDPVSRRTLWEYLHDVRRRERTTVFLTTHYLDEAENADHVCVIDEGKVLLYGTPRDMKDRLVQEYLLLDADDRDGLLRDLSAWRTQIVDEHARPLRIRLRNNEQAQEIIRAAGVSFSHLDIEHPTLEEAYVKLIEKSTAETPATV
ncbi:ABC transporter ATP-binding protein [Candidatus Kaiserbacteria bacterium]|nr:ABC transporter ATP-binding protein [Candidatus Kaiserbacteria bacterium]